MAARNQIHVCDIVTSQIRAGPVRPRHTMRQISATRRGDRSPRLHCCCDKSLALSLSLRYVARIQTSFNLCDRSQRRNSVAATMIFICHTRRFVAATCRGDVSQRFVASCVSAFNLGQCLNVTLLDQVAVVVSLLTSCNIQTPSNIQRRQMRLRKNVNY